MCLVSVWEKNENEKKKERVVVQRSNRFSIAASFCNMPETRNGDSCAATCKVSDKETLVNFNK